MGMEKEREQRPAKTRYGEGQWYKRKREEEGYSSNSDKYKNHIDGA